MKTKGKGKRSAPDSKVGGGGIKKKCERRKEERKNRGTP